MSQSPGKPPTQEEVAQIVREVDLDGDGTINFNGMCISRIHPAHPTLERERLPAAQPGFPRTFPEPPC
jgi:hypothetical protein